MRLSNIVGLGQGSIISRSMLCNVAISKSVVVHPPTTSVPFFWVLHAVVLGIFASLEKTHTFRFALLFDMLTIQTRTSRLRTKQGKGHGPEGTRSRRLIGWFYAFAGGALGRAVKVSNPHFIFTRSPEPWEYTCIYFIISHHATISEEKICSILAKREALTKS